MPVKDKSIKPGSVFMTFFERKRSVMARLQKDLDGIEHRRFLAMRQLTSQCERMKMESHRIHRRTISVDALQIPATKAVDELYWEQLKQVAQQEAERMMVKDTKKQDKNSTLKNRIKR